MSDHGKWLIDLERKPVGRLPDGLLPVSGYRPEGRPPEEVAIMEKAGAYNAQYVFFEAGQNGRPSTAQALVFVSDDSDDDQQFAILHRRLWSWGGVPLLYRKTAGLVQLFRCAHKPDFVSPSGQIICKPIKTLSVAASIASDDAWWDATRLRNGTLWDDPAVCRTLMSASKSAHKHLIEAVKQLNKELNEEGILKRHLRRRLLILSLLIAYLEERGVFPTDYFGQFQKGATKFFQVLANGKALVTLLADLEERFNGHVFTLEDADRVSLRGSAQLARFAKLVEAHEEVIAFIGNELPRWRDRPDRKAETSETVLTSQLCSHLNSVTRHAPGWDILQFRMEEPDEKHKGRKIDLVPAPSGVNIWVDGRKHADFDPLLPIECKRLPTPSGTDRDEREYVFSKFGSTGGIQRFKAGHHGSQHKLGAMIGYIQHESCDHWGGRVKGWINELVKVGEAGWASSDHLKQVATDTARRLVVLQSAHKRQKSLADISIQHLWIDIS
jgi:hypothetical protein